MQPVPSPLPSAHPGQWVRWRHPRLAIARGWFHVFGPGPFEVLRVLGGTNGAPAMSYVIRTPLGERTISALWVGPPEST
jgi:hypothetical protein